MLYFEPSGFWGTKTKNLYIDVHISKICQLEKDFFRLGLYINNELIYGAMVKIIL